MTYIGVNPLKNIFPYIDIKPLESYPKEVIKDIKLVSVSKDKMATPFGSFIYRIQKYPGDVDLVEEFTSCCSVEHVGKSFSNKLRNIVKNIVSLKQHYFSEVKAGLDKRYDVDIGELNNGVYFIDLDLPSVVAKMYKKKLFDKEEKSYFDAIFKKSKNSILDGDDFDVIYNLFRERRILRWSVEEILKGEKTLPGGKKKLLKNAVVEKSAVKIDMISLINNKFVEVTNFFFLGLLKEDNVYPINLDPAEAHNIPLSLPQEINKLYYSNYYYSPFKMVKRIYSLSRHLKDMRMLEKIIPFVSSNTSLLYQLKSEIDTISLILKKEKNPSPTTIFNQLDNMKLRFATVLELDKESLQYLNNAIDTINKNNNRENKIILLGRLKKSIIAKINYETISYLNTVGLNPPPNNLLPKIITYSRNILRTPIENPINPFDIIKINAINNSIAEPDPDNIDFLPDKKVGFSENPTEKKKLNELKHLRIEKAKQEVAEAFDIPESEVGIEEIIAYNPRLLYYRPSETKRTLTNKEVLIRLELQKNKNKLFKKYGPVDSSISTDELLKEIYDSNSDVKKMINKAIKGKTLAAGSLASRLFQSAANKYRKNFCNGRSRPLYDGEYHLGCHNFTGPGTRIDLADVLNYKPYNDIDNCSRIHDIQYGEANGIPELIRKADEEAIKCYNKYPNESGFAAAKSGINGKMSIENVFPAIIRSIAPKYSGKGYCDYEGGYFKPVNQGIGYDDSIGGGLEYENLPYLGSGDELKDCLERTIVLEKNLQDAIDKLKTPYQTYEENTSELPGQVRNMIENSLNDFNNTEYDIRGGCDLCKKFTPEEKEIYEHSNNLPGRIRNDIQNYVDMTDNIN